MTTQELLDAIQTRAAALVPLLTAKTDADDDIQEIGAQRDVAQNQLNLATAAYDAAVDVAVAADDAFDTAVQEFADYIATLKAI